MGEYERIRLIGPAGVSATACRQGGPNATCEAPAVIAFRNPPATRESPAGPLGVSGRPIVPGKPGNAGGGKGPQLDANARSDKDGGIGDQPNNPEQCSEVTGSESASARGSSPLRRWPTRWWPGRSPIIALGPVGVGFSATIRKMNSRISLLVDPLPTRTLDREIHFRYRVNPVRSKRTTVSGCTRINAYRHPDQKRRSVIQRSRSPFENLGYGRRLAKTESCCTNARFSKSNRDEHETSKRTLPNMSLRRDSTPLS
jgi:hypothetical protein